METRMDTTIHCLGFRVELLSIVGLPDNIESGHRVPLLVQYSPYIFPNKDP